MDAVLQFWEFVRDAQLLPIGGVLVTAHAFVKYVLPRLADKGPDYLSVWTAHRVAMRKQDRLDRASQAPVPIRVTSAKKAA